ncbi:MAG TPA: PQQ-binding-like beta-propeller repeat protein [Rudaea sp.]|jgi:alcohol dehydrogenase (cytochrome c)|uniref:outer membrane protein assembly factor BamB family protein n=1 Tax=Rudaea sp. TaxID=2136325 RepID=UPI002F94E144
MRASRIGLAAGLGILFLAGAAHAAGDAAAGKTVFENQCAACHTTEVGKNGFGPSLAGVAGRKSGSLAGYTYSAAMANSNLTWDAATLDQFLASSTTKVPGTSMPVAIADATARANLIAYLATLAGAPAAAAAPAPPPTPLPAGPTSDELLHSATDTQGWLYASKDYTGGRYVALNQINAGNAHTLRAACIYRSSTTGSLQTSPLVYKGILYFTIDNVTVAIDATTCREKWTNTWDLKTTPLSKSNRGAAIANGRLVRGTPDGYLIALNMANGALLWSQKIADPNMSQYLSMPPLIYGDTIIYGPAGADWGEKGWIGAFNLETGERIWKFNLIPDADEPGADSWKDPAARAHGGGSLWTPLALDAAKGVLYIPVGNPAPDFFGAARPGDNLYTNSLVALDVKTGKLLWYHQFGPNDVNDRDLSQVSPLFSATVKGNARNLVTVSGKDGLLRVFDRDTHEQLYELPITTRTGVEEKPTVAGVHGCPGLLGGMEWNGPAYSPTAKTLYVATVDWCGTFTKLPNPPAFALNAHYYGGAVTPDPRDQARGWLYAIDAASGTVRWHQQWPTPLLAAVTATAGGVLFTGDLDNNFLAIDAANGKTLYKFNTGGSIGGGVLTYAIGGKQYVATTSGVVSGFFGGTGAATIVVFTLP